ncbi:MAG: methyltransferase family protein [Acidobacteriota bacterium]
MKSYAHLGRFGALLVLGLAACEVLLMISPFAGFFYASLQFEPVLGILSNSPFTAWLDGFFLNHSVVTTSSFLEWQRTFGLYLFALGIWGFLVSAIQVYGNKIRGRGVATGLLYRFSRHPQYLCLAIAGWGLLTIWPRLLLLGLWVTMLFLYAGLARFEEYRMAERFGDSYRAYADRRSAFLPGNPVGRMLEAGFGWIKPRPLRWVAAYACSLIVVFAAGFALRAYTGAHVVTLRRPDAVVISAWPQSEEWLGKVFDTALGGEGVRERLQTRGTAPVVATVLPPRYVMKGMFYKMPPTSAPTEGTRPRSSSLAGIVRIAVGFLLPCLRSGSFMGVDPDSGQDPVEVVFSRAEKPYREEIPLNEALDASVRLKPFLVVDVQPPRGPVTGVRTPLPQNRWGPRVVMPLF